MSRVAATYSHFLTAVREERLRVSGNGRVETRGPLTANSWKKTTISWPYQKIAFSCSLGFMRCEIQRLVWYAVKGDIPEGREVDYINGEILDNRIENLHLLPPWERLKPCIAALKRAARRRLSPEMIHAIQTSDEPLSVLADRYDMNKSSISRIRSGLSYKS